MCLSTPSTQDEVMISIKIKCKTFGDMFLKRGLVSTTFSHVVKTLVARCMKHRNDY